MERNERNKEQKEEMRYKIDSFVALVEVDGIWK